MHFVATFRPYLLKYVLIFSSFFFVLSAQGKESRPSQSAKRAKPAVTAQMKKAEFLGRLRIELRKQLCQEGGLTDCFNVSRESCEGFVTDRFDECAKRTKVSDPVSLVGEDLVIAESTGQCISENFGRKFKSKIKESEECKTLR